jgi:hypothetical protein
VQLYALQMALSINTSKTSVFLREIFIPFRESCLFVGEFYREQAIEARRYLNSIYSSNMIYTTFLLMTHRGRYRADYFKAMK